MKNHFYLTLLILQIFSIDIFAQNKVFTQCDLKLNLILTKNDTIILKTLIDDKQKVLTQNEFNEIIYFVSIDKNNGKYARINSIIGIVTVENNEFDTELWTDSLSEAMTKEYSGLWIENKNLNIDFDEWVFLDKENNPKEINQPFIYSHPSTNSTKTRISPREWLKEKENSFERLYDIHIIECKGQWLKVKINLKDNVLEGWMPWYNFCFHVLTNCHYLPEDGVKNEE